MNLGPVTRVLIVLPLYRFDWRARNFRARAEFPQA
ncbi:MAG: hypothetical protein ACI945_001914 [Pseudohongiellaceae bacterium]|jgi:hypothetical protein